MRRTHWLRTGYWSEEVIEKGLDFVERFPDSPWSAPVRRGLLADLAGLLSEKGEAGAYTTLRERYEALTQAARDRGELPKEVP